MFDKSLWNDGALGGDGPLKMEGADGAKGVEDAFGNDGVDGVAYEWVNGVVGTDISLFAGEELG